VWAAVGHEGKIIGRDATKIQQRAALGRRAVGGEGFAFGFEGGDLIA